jgi:hypothetical protein
MMAEMVFMLMVDDKNFMRRIMDPVEIFSRTLSKQEEKFKGTDVEKSSNRDFINCLLNFSDPTLLVPTL